jgi:class 3 adenylate cyclase
MFRAHRTRKLATMIEIDSAPLNWRDVGVGELVPTGTVTLLLADVEGSTRLWESQPDEMTAAFATLDVTLAELVTAHHGVRPMEQGEGDSFVVAFGRASDAVACALALQRAALDPIRLRIGIHTGEVQLRDEANYIGPTINRTARLRDLGHGGQTVLSSITAELVTDRLPAEAWLTDLGGHPVRDLPRPEHVVQLCHRETRNEFPPLRTAKPARAHNLPAQLTNFIGRHTVMVDVGRSLVDNRLVTLTGAGGALRPFWLARGQFQEGSGVVRRHVDRRAGRRCATRGLGACGGRPMPALDLVGRARQHRAGTFSIGDGTAVRRCVVDGRGAQRVRHTHGARPGDEPSVPSRGRRAGARGR